MNKLIQHIKHADKRKFFIYLFSFLIFIGINNLFENILFLSYGPYTQFNFWCYHGVLCSTPRLVYDLGFQGFKILVFIFFFFLSKRFPDKVFIEFFIAYFIYDLVYILAVIWDQFIPMGSQYMLESSAQAVLQYYTLHLWLYVSIAWTILLFLVLKRQKRLSIIYLLNRLVIIPFSVIFISISLYLVVKFTHQFQDHYYNIKIDKYDYYVGRILNITKQEIIRNDSASEYILIKFPKRTDSITFYDRNGDIHKDTSTTSYFTVERILDTLSGKTIDSLINSEIKLWYVTKIELPYQKWKQKVTGFQIRVLFPDGTSYFNYIKGNKISLDTEAVREIHKNINNSYIVIGTIFFLNDKGEEMKANNQVAWKMKW